MSFCGAYAEASLRLTGYRAISQTVIHRSRPEPPGNMSLCTYIRAQAVDRRGINGTNTDEQIHED